MLKQPEYISDTGASPLISVPSHIIPCEKHRDAEEENHILEVQCYQLSIWKSVGFYVLCLATGGILFLLQWWFLNLHLSLRYFKASPQNATHVVVKSSYSSDLIQLTLKSTITYGAMLTFEYHFLPYFLNGDKFSPLYMETAINYKQLIDKYSPGIYNIEDVAEKQKMYGKCQILVPVRPIPRLLIDELLHPFFIFQLFGIVLWMQDGYQLYASAIIILTTISLITSLVETRSNLSSIRKMAYYETDVNVIREGNLQKVSSVELVPGDLIEIPNNSKMPCDAVLIGGTCVVDEAMLTGESVAVLKDPLPTHTSVKYDLDQDRRYSLYEGTFIIQARSYASSKALGVVTRTGFMTMKGKLVRSILFPKPAKFKFYQDSLKFIVVLFVLAFIGFCAVLPIQIIQGINSYDMIDNSLNLLTTTVPASLPAVMTVGSVFAINRLKKKSIYCISPARMNVAGKIDLIVFDKTGTLTQEGMDLLGICPAINRTFRDLQSNPRELFELDSNLIECMATCHSLIKVNDDLLGDSQDLKIFESTGCEYQEPPEGTIDDIKGIVTISPIDSTEEYSRTQVSPYNLGILHIYHFTSKLKRMAVVVKNMQHNSCHFYLKGATEMVKGLCKPDSLPSNIDSVISHYTRLGYRVMACAAKSLNSIDYDELRASRLEDVESDLSFLGLIILQNKLKPETTPVLETLTNAGLRSVMATGDAALTGISVGRECGMIDLNSNIYFGDLIHEKIQWSLYNHTSKGSINDEVSEMDNFTTESFLGLSVEDNYTVAMSGVAFGKLVELVENKELDKTVLDLILYKGKVYARMSPDHKSILIEQLQKRELLVAMCGDGANDCGALKTAHVGISLSTAEASIAAPFTSKVNSIECVVEVLREGRCALTTSLQCFKFLSLYSLTEFTAVTILYYFASNLSDFQYMFIDLITILPVSITMCYTGPYQELSARQPTATLISTPVLTSVVGQVLIQAITQVSVYLFILSQDFYESLDPDTSDVSENYNCYENTVLFLEINLAFLIICMLFTIGKPWKKAAYTNLYFTCIYIVLLIMSIYLILWPSSLIRDLFKLKDLPSHFKYQFLGICMVYGAVACVFERGLVNWLDYNRHVRSQRSKKFIIPSSSLPYK
jgi:cation-transporting ATPase 13A2